MKTTRPLILIVILVILSFYSYPSTLLSKTDSVHSINDTSKLSENNIYNLHLNKTTKSKTHFDWRKNMPWIGAVLVGLLTVLANIIISKQNRKSNLEIIEKQINNSKDIAIAQIENANKSMQLDFNKTVLSGNRQLWINDLRELISKILAKTMTITIKQNISSVEFEDLRFLLVKAELMLNVKSDRKIHIALTELENCCLDVLKGNKDVIEIEKYASNLKLYTLVTLKKEWEKVKRGE